MQTQVAKQALDSLWPMVALAVERPPSTEDRWEVRRLCGQLRQAAEGDERFSLIFGRLTRHALSWSEARRSEVKDEAEALLDEIAWAAHLLRYQTPADAIPGWQ